MTLPVVQPGQLWRYISSYRPGSNYDGFARCVRNGLAIDDWKSAMMPTKNIQVGDHVLVVGFVSPGPDDKYRPRLVVFLVEEDTCWVSWEYFVQHFSLVVPHTSSL